MATKSKVKKKTVAKKKVSAPKINYKEQLAKALDEIKQKDFTISELKDDLFSARNCSNTYAMKERKAKDHVSFISRQIEQTLSYIPCECPSGFEVEQYHRAIREAQHATQPGERVPGVDKPRNNTISAEDRVIALGQIQGALNTIYSYIQNID